MNSSFAKYIVSPQVGLLFIIPALLSEQIIESRTKPEEILENELKHCSK
jgi:hypothetical protein